MSHDEKKSCDEKEADSDDDKYSLVSKVQAFCTANEFEQAFEDFALEHYDAFEGSTEMKENSEQPLEYYEIYNAYLRRFEAKIERFIDEVTL